MLTTELQADYNQYDAQEGGNQSLLAGLLSTTVNLYPNSDYPTTFTFNQNVKQSTRSDSSEDRVQSNTLFSINNRYQPENETYSTQALYTFNITDESEDSRNYVQNALDFTFMDAFEWTNYRVTARLNNENRRYLDLDNEHNDASLQFQQFWFLNESDSASLFADVTHENDIETEGIHTSERDYERAQITATSFIRSAMNDRLTYSFNGFVNKTENATNDLDAVEQSSTSLSAGSIYDYSDQIRFTASLDGFTTDNDNEKTESASALVSLNYQDKRSLSETVQLSWFAHDSVSFVRGDETSSINSVQFGDGFTKILSLYDTDLSVSLDQTINHEFSLLDADGDLLDEWKITNDLAFDWSANSGAVNSIVHLLFSDSRHLTLDKRQFQQVYLSLQRNQILGNADNWGGNFVYEWNKTVGELGEQESNMNASGILWYRNIELWNVEGMRFTSTLTLPLNNLLPDDELRNDELTSWENELDYRIGFLELRLHNVNTENSYYVAFEVKRNFDF